VAWCVFKYHREQTDYNLGSLTNTLRTWLVAPASDVSQVQRLAHSHRHGVSHAGQCPLEGHHTRHVAVEERQDDGIPAGFMKCSVIYVTRNC
jgi:hypothetical protein